MKRGVGVLTREVVMTHVTTRWTRSFLASINAAEVPDPGAGIDELCPILYFESSEVFDPSTGSDLAALGNTLYATEDLRSRSAFIVDITGGTWDGQSLPLNVVGVRYLLETLGGTVEVFPENGGFVPGDVTNFEATDDDPAFTGIVSATNIQGVGYCVMNVSQVSSEPVDMTTYGSFSSILLRVWYATAGADGPATADRYAGAMASLLRGVKWVGDASLPEGDLRKDMADSGMLILRHLQRAPIPESATRVGDDPVWSWYQQQIILHRQIDADSIGSVNPSH